jgi:hypothetical protein
MTADEDSKDEVRDAPNDEFKKSGEDVIKILFCVAAGGFVLTAIVVGACLRIEPTNPFWGLLAMGTVPIGCIVGAIVGSYLTKHGML